MLAEIAPLLRWAKIRSGVYARSLETGWFTAASVADQIDEPIEPLIRTLNAWYHLGWLKKRTNPAGFALFGIGDSFPWADGDPWGKLLEAADVINGREGIESRDFTC